MSDYSFILTFAHSRTTDGHDVGAVLRNGPLGPALESGDAELRPVMDAPGAVQSWRLTMHFPTLELREEALTEAEAIARAEGWL